MLSFRQTEQSRRRFSMNLTVELIIDHCSVNMTSPARDMELEHCNLMRLLNQLISNNVNN